MSTFKETSEREFHIINFIDKSLVTFTPDPSIGMHGLLVKGVNVKDSNKKDVFIGLTDGTKFKYLTNDDYDIYYQSSDSIYVNKNAGTQGWPIYMDLYKENIGIIASIKYSYNGVYDQFFTINYIPYEVLRMNITYSGYRENIYLFIEELPSSYSVSPNKHIALYSGVSGNLSSYGTTIYYDPMNILVEKDKSIKYYVDKGVITYKSGDPSNLTLGKYIREVTFVNKPYTNKDKDTIEIAAKDEIYCYEYSDNKWKLNGHCIFMEPNGKKEPLVYKSVAHYQ